MKVADHPEWDDERPEEFDWSVLISWRLEEAVNKMVRTIREDLKRPVNQRFRVAGLRAALIIIANDPSAGAMVA